MGQTGASFSDSLAGPPATVLGVLNITPDSFSDGGQFMDLDAAIAHAKQMIAEGADIIDVGGESTRPGSAPVDPQEEAARIVPVIEAISPLCRVSVDTRNAGVAAAGVAAGASIINDIGASLSTVAAELGVGWIAMHMQGQPGSMQRDPTYDDVVDDVCSFLSEKAKQAADQGVSEIWIDPGIGFGKSLDHNLQLLAHIDKLVDTGWPVAIGTSRKSMLGQLIARSDGADHQTPLEDRLVGSVTTAAYAMLHGVALIRVHDVKAAKQAATVVAGER